MSSVVILLLTSISLSSNPSPAPTDFVSKILGEYGLSRELTPVVLMFVVFGTLVIILKNAKDFLESYEKLQGYWQKLQGTSTKELEKNRKDLLNRLRREVSQRCSGSLLKMEDWVCMDVQKQNRPEAISNSPLPAPPIRPTTAPQRNNFFTQVGRILRRGNQPAEMLEDSQPISEIFHRSSGRLLILGEPGSGKTTELLRLADQLLNQAESDSTNPIPVIFELSAWKDDRQPIEEWLVAQLKEIYNVPTATSQNWLQNNQLIPLLDGLDELAVRREDNVDRSRQILCVRAINEFASSYPKHKLTVCCRQEDYKEGDEQGRVRLDRLKRAVQLQPLKDSQIESYFNELKRSDIWEQICQNQELKQLAKFPLFLNMIVLAWQEGKRISNQTELFTAYIDEQFKKQLDNIYKQEGGRKRHKKYPNGRHPYKRTDATLYLKVLARNLKKQSKTEFLIEKLQPSILAEKQLNLYRLIYGTLAGTIYVIVFSPAILISLFEAMKGEGYSLAIEVLVGWLSVLFSCIIATILFTLLHRDSDVLTINPVEKFKVALNCRTFRYLLEDLIAALGVAWLIAVFLKGFYKLDVRGDTVGLIIGLLFGAGLFISTLYRKNNNEISIRSKPNQGIFNSAFNALFIFSLFFLLAFIAYIYLWLFFQEYVNRISFFLIIFLSFSFLLFAGLFYGGGKACIQHFALRMVLWKSNLAPWNYAYFLDYAHDLRFIQRIGGRYRFRHDLLREHFAKMEE